MRGVRIESKTLLSSSTAVLNYAAEPEPALIVASAQSVSDKSANPTRDSSLQPETNRMQDQLLTGHLQAIRAKCCVTCLEIA